MAYNNKLPNNRFDGFPQRENKYQNQQPTVWRPPPPFLNEKQAQKSRPKRSQAPARPPPPSRIVTEPQEPSDEFPDYYDGVEPIQHRFGQNNDHSNYINLIDASYNELCSVESNVKNNLPFPKYQKYCIDALNVRLMQVDQIQNRNNRVQNEGEIMNIFPEDAPLHAPVHAYLDNIGQVTTAAGCLVHMALPQIAIPTLDVENVPDGTFGLCDAERHNVYECYTSPFVARALIERTVFAARNPLLIGADWNPLPVGLYPALCVANRNLLCYRRPDAVTREGLASLENIQWEFSNDLQRRLQISQSLICDTISILDKLETRVKLRRGIPVTKNSNVSLAFLEAKQHIPPGEAVFNAASSILANQSLGGPLTKKIAVLSNRRRRNANGRGLCYLTIAGNARRRP